MLKRMLAVSVGMLMIADHLHGDTNKPSFEEVRSRLCERIVLGLSRAQVEDRLADLPVVFTYASSDFLGSVGQGVYKGNSIGGRYDIRTDVKIGPSNGFSKRQLFIWIYLDSREKVIDMRMEAFGMALSPIECLGK